MENPGGHARHLPATRPTARAGQGVSDSSREAGNAPGTVAVAVAAPLRRVFDYLPPKAGSIPRPGCRVLVPFGRGTKIGVVVPGRETSDLAPERLKSIIDCETARYNTLTTTRCSFDRLDRM